MASGRFKDLADLMREPTCFSGIDLANKIIWSDLHPLAPYGPQRWDNHADRDRNTVLAGTLLSALLVL